jgi:hypothetical protein
MQKAARITTLDPQARLAVLLAATGLTQVDLANFDNGAALADELKQATAQHSGHAGPAFVAGIVDRLPEIVRAIGNARNNWLEENMPSRADGQVRRAAAKFALIAAAGELAATILDLPWPKDAASNAVATCFKERAGGCASLMTAAGFLTTAGRIVRRRLAGDRCSVATASDPGLASTMPD